MMLNVADIDKLMFQFGHAIPTEATIGAFEIQCVYGIVDDPIAESQYSSTSACVYGSPSVPSLSP
jgi:hypothetical protein